MTNNFSQYFSLESSGKSSFIAIHSHFTSWNSKKIKALCQDNLRLRAIQGHTRLFFRRKRQCAMFWRNHLTSINLARLSRLFKERSVSIIKNPFCRLIIRIWEIICWMCAECSKKIGCSSASTHFECRTILRTIILIFWKAFKLLEYLE